MTREEEYYCTIRSIYMPILAFHMIYQKTHLIRLDIYKLGSKSLIASYSFKFKTLSLFKRKVFQGVVSLDQMIEENSKRGYTYDD